MKDKIFKKFKDNYQMIISVGTVSLTIVYATICYFVYIYNRGQVDAFHVDPHLIKINYIEYIYALIFVLPFLPYFLLTSNWIYHNFKSQKDILKKLPIIIIIVICTFLPFYISFNYLIPNQHDFIYVLKGSIFLYVAFILLFIVLLYCSGNFISDLKKFAFSSGIIAIIFVLSLIFCIFNGCIYYDGFNSIKEKDFYITTNINKINYIMVYCNGDQYILCPYELKNDVLIIETTTHKVVGVESIETKTIDSKSVELKS